MADLLESHAPFPRLPHSREGTRDTAVTHESDELEVYLLLAAVLLLVTLPWQPAPDANEVRSRPSAGPQPKLQEIGPIHTPSPPVVERRLVVLKLFRDVVERFHRKIEIQDHGCCSHCRHCSPRRLNVRSTYRTCTIRLIRLCDSVVYGGPYGMPGKGRRV